MVSRKKHMTLGPDDLNAVFSSMAEGLLVVDASRNIAALNQVGGILLRVAPVQAVGAPIADIFKLYRIEQNKRTPWPLDNLIKLDFTRVHIWDHVYCENKVGKLFPLTLMATPLLKAGSMNGAVILFRDATDEARVDLAKSDFVAVASHQLQTPLTAMKLFAEMLDQDTGDLTAQQRKEYQQLLRSSVERMIKLVNEMLNVSRLEAGALRIQPQTTDPVAFLRQIIKELEPIAKEHACALAFVEPPKPLRPIPIDANLLSQVLFNLVENAMRYSTGRACRVAVSCENKPADRTYVFRVADNGIGIANADKKRIFSKFFRADNARKLQSNGSGLGLYVVKMIVEAWGGQIWFTSREGAGSAFSVSIPSRGMKARKGTKQLSK